MERKIKNLVNQAETIEDTDFLIINRLQKPFRLSGKAYKEFCSNVMNFPVRYYKSKNIECSKRSEVYTLGFNILTRTGTEGVPIKIVSNNEVSEKGWMFHSTGSPNKITISFSDFFEEFKKDDTTALTNSIVLETFSRLFKETSDLAYTIVGV